MIQQPIRQTATGSTEGMRRNQHVTRTAVNHTDSNKQYRQDVQESTRDTAVNHTDSNKQYRGDVQESTRDTAANHTDSNKQYRQDVQESTCTITHPTTLTATW